MIKYYTSSLNTDCFFAAVDDVGKFNCTISER